MYVLRKQRYGVMFLHALAPATIWTYVSAYRSAGGDMDLCFCICLGAGCDLHAMWKYVSECLSAVDDMELRFCMF